MTVEVRGSDARLDLYWIPLGAGARVVWTSGRIYEGLAALAQRTGGKIGRTHGITLHQIAYCYNMPEVLPIVTISMSRG